MNDTTTLIAAGFVVIALLGIAIALYLTKVCQRCPDTEYESKLNYFDDKNITKDIKWK